MRIIVDTSVWSLALRRHRPSSHSEVDKLGIIIEAGEEILLLGVVLTEVLQGVRERRHFDQLQRALEPFPLLEPSRDDYVYAAEIRNQCLSKGIAASTIDFLIAGTAIRHKAHLLTTDEDFRRISTIVPLKLC